MALLPHLEGKGRHFRVWTVFAVLAGLAVVLVSEACRAIPAFSGLLSQTAACIHVGDPLPAAPQVALGPQSTKCKCPSGAAATQHGTAAPEASRGAPACMQPSDRDWLKRLKTAEQKVFSQNGEDGILLRILANIGWSDRRYYVEVTPPPKRSAPWYRAALQCAIPRVMLCAVWDGERQRVQHPHPARPAGVERAADGRQQRQPRHQPAQRKHHPGAHAWVVHACMASRVRGGAHLALAAGSPVHTFKFPLPPQENINDLFAKYDVPEEFDVLSIGEGLDVPWSPPRCQPLHPSRPPACPLPPACLPTTQTSISMITGFAKRWTASTAPGW